MTDTLVQRVRESRTSGAVLKIRLSNIRARNRTVTVLVFEGADDVGPFGAWIARIDDKLKYEPPAGAGKDQLLDLRARLLEDKGGLRSGVYFFVDRDFDDLKGHQPGAELYCTDFYSVENYLASDDVLTRVLADELRCSAENDDRDNIVGLFRTLNAQFLEHMREVNARLYRGTKLGIRGRGIEESIGKYVQIDLREVSAVYTPEALTRLIPLSREPAADESVEIDREFRTLVPAERYRGKFLIAFVMRWVELVAADRASRAPALFSKRADIKFSAQKLSLGSLAARSRIPQGLETFVRAIRPVQQMQV